MTETIRSYSKGDKPRLLTTSENFSMKSMFRILGIGISTKLALPISDFILVHCTPLGWLPFLHSPTHCPPSCLLQRKFRLLLVCIFEKKVFQEIGVMIAELTIVVGSRKAVNVSIIYRANNEFYGWYGREQKRLLRILLLKRVHVTNNSLQKYSSGPSPEAKHLLLLMDCWKLSRWSR